MIVALDLAHLLRSSLVAPKSAIGSVLLLILSVVCRHCGSHAVVPIVLPGIIVTLAAILTLAVWLLLVAIFFILVDRQQVLLAVLVSDFASGDMRCCPLLSHPSSLFLCICSTRVLGDLHVGVD